MLRLRSVLSKGFISRKPVAEASQASVARNRRQVGEVEEDGEGKGEGYVVVVLITSLVQATRGAAYAVIPLRSHFSSTLGWFWSKEEWLRSLF